MGLSRKLMAMTTVMLGGLAAGPSMAADPFPTEPIQLIIPFSPGDTDKMLRPIADRMRDALGHPLILQYKPGAGGGLGASQVAAARPDGYTLLGSSPGALVVVPLANKEFTYQTESFAPVAAFTKGALLLLVPADSPYRTLSELVKDAKAKPGQISYGSSGMMGITHLLAEIFAQDAGIQLMHVPYQGSTPAIVDLLGKQINMAAAAIGPSMGHIKAGKLRPLAVFSDTRMSVLPDVPTVAELGFGVGMANLYGIVAPKGTPPERIDAIYQAAQKAVAAHRQEISQSLESLGAEIDLLGPKEYGDYLAQQKALFAKGIQGLTPAQTAR